ncbi:Adaptor complexes medium subunit family-domain-containing protein [Neohortaea acidophila]|uniref:Adaptor complexes medium subunit family-domain-containing protein n=1 Tax=Neohortaea acidophila TaxID=245834 RepID=A0A6A6PZS2_9PEZI|nr:Adaptor complexes medium subunit family-domain-containing protein [Neohortaea acidophila]KAF2485271.1 Adaptor complexes medium subunit family-domain-containing protein [Neohortaea acidophila]
MSAIDALYIFDEHNALLFDHTYTNRPPSPSVLLPLYLQQPSPRPSLIYLPSFTPPILCYSIIQDNILFLSPCSSSAEPLLVLEFLHRVADALQEFLGSPLMATKITSSYDIIAQIAAEIADAGIVCQSEANALRDVVETGSGVLKNLLDSIGASASSPALSISGGAGSSSIPAALRSQLQPAQSSQGSAVPWRRSNVRHTSNELYVDFVESLFVTLAPSGRALSAFAHGSIMFNCKVSGVPDLVLNLMTDGKGAGMGTKGEQLQRVMERVVFHPCVRLNRWKSDGSLSFVPPDGKFALCGYEVDLLGPDAPLTVSNPRAKSTSGLDLPVSIDVSTGLGTNGADFEVRITQPVRSLATASLQSNLGPQGRSKPGQSGRPQQPVEDITIHVPIPPNVRNVSDLRPSKGEAHWNPATSMVEWHVLEKDVGPSGVALRCTVQGKPAEEDEEFTAGGVMNGVTATTYDYDDDVQTGDTSRLGNQASSAEINGSSADSQRQRLERNRELMPTSATLSFSLKGSLPSGLRVESLAVDNKRSRGLGADIKPYKGVKYLTVSRKGIEMRC